MQIANCEGRIIQTRTAKHRIFDAYPEQRGSDRAQGLPILDQVAVDPLVAEQTPNNPRSTLPEQPRLDLLGLGGK